MLKALAGFVVGFYAGERRAAEATTPREGGSASGWLAAFLILIGLLAWGNADLRSHARPGAHTVVAHRRRNRAARPRRLVYRIFTGRLAPHPARRPRGRVALALPEQSSRGRSKN
jgi:hypothetical protein